MSAFVDGWSSDFQSYWRT